MNRFLVFLACSLVIANAVPTPTLTPTSKPTTTPTTTPNSTATSDESITEVNPYPINDQFECHFSYQCGRHGVCKSHIDRDGQNATDCECDTQYATENSDKPCGYHRKSRGVALLLSILQVPALFGAYWFYLGVSGATVLGNGGYIFGGVLQIVLIWGGSLIFISDLPDRIRGFGMFMLVCGVLMIQIAWIVVVAGGFPDGNGVATAWYMP